jgi:hypothetical protein
MTGDLSILSPSWIVRAVLTPKGTDMAKGQQRSNREAKKPKADKNKKKAVAVPVTVFPAAKSKPR